MEGFSVNQQALLEMQINYERAQAEIRKRTAEAELEAALFGKTFGTIPSNNMELTLLQRSIGSNGPQANQLTAAVKQEQPNKEPPKTAVALEKLKGLTGKAPKGFVSQGIQESPDSVRFLELLGSMMSLKEIDEVLDVLKNPKSPDDSVVPPDLDEVDDGTPIGKENVQEQELPIITEAILEQEDISATPEAQQAQGMEQKDKLVDINEIEKKEEAKAQEAVNSVSKFNSIVAVPQESVSPLRGASSRSSLVEDDLSVVNVKNAILSLVIPFAVLSLVLLISILMGMYSKQNQTSSHSHGNDCDDNKQEFDATLACDREYGSV